MSGGWIKLYRELLDKPIWQCSRPEQKAVLITVLLLANHADNEWIFEGVRYVCKPGQFVTSLQQLSIKSGVSIRSVRTALDNFEKTHHFLTNKSTKRNRLITVVNWELYQSNEEEPTKKPTNNRQTTDKQPTTNKNDKNDKNDKNTYVGKIFQTIESYLGPISENAKLTITSYLDDDVEPDMIIEAMRDSIGKDKPDDYCCKILSKCHVEGVKTFQGYLFRKAERVKKAEEIKKAQYQQKVPQHENFDQRQYNDGEFDKYYVDVTEG